MDAPGANHPDLKILEETVEGLGLHIQSAGIAAEGRHNHAVGIGNEATAANAMPTRLYGAGGMQVAGNLEHAGPQ